MNHYYMKLTFILFAFTLASTSLVFYLINQKSEYNKFSYSHIYSDQIQVESDRRSFDDVISRLAQFDPNRPDELLIDYERTHNRIVFNQTAERVVFYQPWNVGYGKQFLLITSLISNNYLESDLNTNLVHSL